MMKASKTSFTGGRIYEVVCNKTGQRYIGKTILSLKARLSRHKSEYNMWIKRGSIGKKCTIYPIIEGGDYCINELELVDKETNIYHREGHFQQILECVNKNINTGYSNNDNREYNLSYYEKNKKSICAKHREYYSKKSTCPHCGKELNRNFLRKHRQNIHSNIPIPPKLPLTL